MANHGISHEQSRRKSEMENELLLRLGAKKEEVGTSRKKLRSV